MTHILINVFKHSLTHAHSRSHAHSRAHIHARAHLPFSVSVEPQGMLADYPELQSSVVPLSEDGACFVLFYQTAVSQHHGLGRSSCCCCCCFPCPWLTPNISLWCLCFMSKLFLERVVCAELRPLITPIVLKKITAASPDQRAIYDWAWSGNSQATRAATPHTQTTQSA